MEDMERKIEDKDTSNPVINEVKKEYEKPKEKSNTLYIVITVLTTLLVCLIGYFVYTRYFQEKDTVDNTETNTDNSTTDTQEGSNTTDTIDDGLCSIDEGCDEPEDVTETISPTFFEGEVLSAELPDGWRFIEYMDGEGTESLMSNETYSGLTALDVVNPDNERVFSMKAVTGIGFAGCPVYVIFEDNNEAYQSEMESYIIDGTEFEELKDYSDKEYSEFDLLGTTIRRINKEYYYDTREGNNYFEPPCHSGVINLEGLYYTDGSGYKGEAYFYGAEDTAVEEDLLIVDKILDSVKLVK